MNIKTKTKREFKLTVNKKELQTIQLALALMNENDYTHPAWIKKIAPILEAAEDALGMEKNS